MMDTLTSMISKLSGCCGDLAASIALSVLLQAQVY
jgi:hypothetical protein